MPAASTVPPSGPAIGGALSAIDLDAPMFATAAIAPLIGLVALVVPPASRAYATLGSTTGCGGRECCPARGVTRAEMAVFIYPRLPIGHTRQDSNT